MQLKLEKVLKNSERHSLIEKSVQHFIEKYNLKEPFVVAFSGGYDSMCLLDVLCKLNYKPIVIHLNHNWRGKESDAEELVCKNFAKSRELVFYSEKLLDNVEHTETAARDARYEFFYRCAQKFNSRVIFTAHNFDDNAETVLYRIIKGTGVVGLQGISEKRDIFYRPLLSVKRCDIENYCKVNDLNPNKDSSNDDIKYKRNLIRKKIIPLLQEINPSVKKALNSLSDIAKMDTALIEKYAKNDISYSVRNMLIDNGIDYDRKKIEEIKNFIEENKNLKSGKKMSLSDNLWLFVNRDGYKVITTLEKNNNSILINKEGTYNFGKYIFSIKRYDKLPKSYPKDSELKAYIKADCINFELRYRRDGDIIYPLGCNGSQKLKKYLNEKKVPNHIKDSIPLLAVGNEILWVAGLGISDKIKVVDKPTHYLELRVKDE